MPKSTTTALTKHIYIGTSHQQILQQTLQISYKTYHSHLLKCLLLKDLHTKLNCI